MTDSNSPKKQFPRFDMPQTLLLSPPPDFPHPSPLPIPFVPLPLRVPPQHKHHVTVLTAPMQSRAPDFPWSLLDEIMIGETGMAEGDTRQPSDAAAGRPACTATGAHGPSWGIARCKIACGLDSVAKTGPNARRPLDSVDGPGRFRDTSSHARRTQCDPCVPSTKSRVMMGIVKDGRTRLGVEAFRLLFPAHAFAFRVIICCFSHVMGKGLSSGPRTSIVVGSVRCQAQYRRQR